MWTRLILVELDALPGVPGLLSLALHPLHPVVQQPELPSQLVHRVAQAPHDQLLLVFLSRDFILGHHCGEERKCFKSC